MVLGMAGAWQTQQNSAASLDVRVETGEINGAQFRIETPAAWNKGLIVYCHGYEIVGGPHANWEDPQMKPFREVFLSRGFALSRAASSLSVMWMTKL